MDTQKSCGLVLFRQSKDGRNYLLLKYGLGHWGLIKGMIEKNEEETETAVREAQEETGISDIQLNLGFREEISYVYTWQGRRIKKHVVYFLGETKEENVTLSHEHTDFQWVSYQKALERITFDNDKQVVTKAESLLAARIA